jgi:hypothetical protein
MSNLEDKIRALEEKKSKAKKPSSSVVLRFETGLNFIGEYEVGKTYQVGEAVMYAGSMYVALMETDTDPHDVVSWQVAAEKGDKGDKGEQGIPGLQGLPGLKGEKGDPGERGLKGEDGKDGKDGRDGKDGERGPKGDRGPQGEKGKKGDTGPEGFMGPHGPRGPQGLPGGPGIGVPAGGTAGQVLGKNSDGDYDTEWVDPSGGGGGLPDPGSSGLVIRTALNTTVARTLTGTTNQVIITNGTGVSGNPTFSLPQDIHTGATPTFAGLNTTGNISPTTDSTRSLGTSSLYYLNTYTDRLYLNATSYFDGGTAGMATLVGRFYNSVTLGLNQTGFDTTAYPFTGGYSVNTAVKGEIYSNSSANGIYSGVRGQATYAGAGGLERLLGVYGSALYEGANIGSITSAVGVYATVDNTSSGVITNAYNIFARTVKDTGAGSNTNVYGLYVESQTTGTTSNYAIYTNTGAVRFGDNVTVVGDVSVTDEAYGAGWNGSLEVPTKNAVYDKIESMGGGGGATVNQTTIDFGSTEKSDEVFNIVDAGISDTSKIIAFVTWISSLGRDADEIMADPISISVEPLAGSMNIYAMALEGTVSGQYAINYQIG